MIQFINEDYNLVESLTGVIPMLAYFGCAISLIFAYLAVYLFVTPHDEIGLIKKNNSSAAVAFVGSLLGFCQPLVTSMNQSANLVDFFMWGVVALAIQVITFICIRIVFPKVSERIEDNELAMGILVAGVSIAVGMMNSAAMTY